MANDIVYERDYREVHKIMSARTFTEEKVPMSSACN